MDFIQAGQTTLDQLKKQQPAQQQFQGRVGDFSNLVGKINTEQLARQKVADSTPAQTYSPSNYSTLNTDLSKLGTMTTPYGGSTNYEKFHPAIDIANKIGTPIPTVKEGTVTAVVTGKKQGDTGYGNYTEITDAQGNKYRYSHLNNAFVKVGQKLTKGQQLGTMGNTGSAYSNSGGTGSHLDLRITDKNGNPLNPLQVLQNS